MLFFGKSKKRVNFLIAGAQKGGTSSLYVYLKEHPLLSGSLNKELQYFNNQVNYTRGTKWYHSNWKDFGKENILYYEATPEYLYALYSPERIAAYNPAMKFICMVRDPVKRAYSAYNMYKQFNVSPQEKEHIIRTYFQHRDPDNEDFFRKIFYNPSGFPSFEEFIESEMHILNNNTGGISPVEPSFIRRGLYMQQLDMYYKFFPKDNFIIFEINELQEKPIYVLDKICSFLEIEHIQWNIKNVNKKYNAREYEAPIPPATIKLLKAFYKPHNEAFFAHIGKRYNWL